MSALLCLIKGINHLLRINAFFHTQIDSSIFCGIQHIVTLILCVVHTKFLLYILRQRMYLQTQISPSHRIKKVKADREFIAKTSIYRIAQQTCRISKNKINRRYFKTNVSKTEIKAVFFRNTIKAPGKIRNIAVQVTHLFHPLSAPRSRIKKRNYPKRRTGCFFQSVPYCLCCRHLRSTSYIRIEHVIPSLHQFFLKPVTDTPINKKSTFIL